MNTTARFELIAFDIYGTVLCTNDSENVLPSRKGFFELISYIRNCFLTIKLVTVSDASLVLLNLDLKDSGIEIDIFDYQFQMEKNGPKNFSRVSEFFGIDPKKILVIGDNFDRDCVPAIQIGSTAFCVPEYENCSDDYDLFKNIIPLIEK